MSAVPDIPGGPAQRLAQACDALRLPADAGQQQKLLRYIEQMQRWNRTYNLTAIRDPGQMLVQHLFDSLSVVAPLERGLPAAGSGARVKLFDVGSGGGLPGVVLAIMRAHWDVHAWTQSRRKPHSCDRWPARSDCPICRPRIPVSNSSNRRNATW